MITLPRSIFAAVRLGLIAVVMTGCGTSSSYLAPTGSNTTLMAGWEQHFALEWTAAPEQGGAQQVTGYIYSRHGEHAMNIRLLAQALDPAGTVVVLPRHRGRLQLSHAQSARPMISSLSRAANHGSSSVNIVTHCRHEHGMRVMSVPQNIRAGPKVS